MVHTDMVNPSDDLDEIDRTILSILTRDPRLPYSDIADELEAQGFEMSSEGIRYRVSNLFESTSILLLTAPKEHGWEVVRLLVSIADEPDAKEAAFDALSEMDFWMVSKTMGAFDLYAVATVKSNRDADDLITEVRTMEHVERVRHTLETDRVTTVDNYLSL